MASEEVVDKALALNETYGKFWESMVFMTEVFEAFDMAQESGMPTEEYLVSMVKGMKDLNAAFDAWVEAKLAYANA